MRTVAKWIALLVLVALLVGLGALIVRRLPAPGEGGPGPRPSGALAAPVEVAAVERGAIENRRVFSGTLEAAARVTIAPKVAGRVVSLALEIADTVRRGQTVAELDSGEYEQSVMQAEAELAVARANVAQAQSAAEIAARELERARTLHERGVASDSELDVVVVDHLAKTAAVEVAEAEVTRAEATVQAARIRLGYTTIKAEWTGGDDHRVVAERFVEEGETVAANTPLLSIIELDPIKAVFYVTERDYALLSADQPVTLAADAYRGREWPGTVARVAPVFREGSRQARVEIGVPNAQGLLKPGMFVRATIVFDRVEDATIVPVEALAQRDGRDVVFVVGADGASVRMVPVEVGFREGPRVQVRGEGVGGRVVTLGQQLLEDGSSITIPNGDERGPARPGARAPGGSEGG